MATSSGTLDDELKHFLIEETPEEFLKNDTELKAGSYGFVYEVRVGGVPRIAKKLHKVFLEASQKEKENVVEKFKKECLILNKLRHPNVVQFIGVYYGKGDKDDIALVMEKLECDLTVFLSDNSNIELSTKVSILHDVSYGLVYLHEYNPPIIHRDLTARNILLDKRHRAKIADVGMAKLMDKEVIKAAEFTRVPGQLYYMPPEAKIMNPSYSDKLDIFSFGHLCLHTLLEDFPKVYELPFAEAKRHEGMIEKHKRQTAFDKIGSDHILCSIIVQCLRDYPEERPTARQLNKLMTSVMDKESLMTSSSTLGFTSNCNDDLLVGNTEEVFYPEVSKELKEQMSKSSAHEETESEASKRKYRERVSSLQNDSMIGRGVSSESCYQISEEKDAEKSTPLAIARSSNQDLQAELLELNGASTCMKDQPSFSAISKKGHLFKTGSDRTGWKRFYCTLDQFRGFEYFKMETDLAPLGYIHMEELLSVEKCDEESSREHHHCFEVNTQWRGYLFSAESEAELKEWIDTFKKIITSDAVGNLGYDKVGYLKKKNSLSVGGWKKRWYTLKGKSLACYNREREEHDEIDLRKVVQLKGPDSLGSPEQQCIFSIVTDEKTYDLKAESLTDAEAWVAALRHTQVSGVPLADQILTNSSVPIIVHKCLQFVESTGFDTVGLYSINGGKAKIRKLILAFNQDAQGVVIDPEKFNVHDVTGTLKQFLRSLPHPVITHELYQEFIAAVQSDDEGQLYRLQALVNRMPNISRETLKRIIQHLRRVIKSESKNKMSQTNITRLLGPTLMTVDVDNRPFDHIPFQYKCIHRLISYYKWIFQVKEDEDKKEEAIEEAAQKIKELELQQKKRLEMVNQKQSTISSATDFMTTVYIGYREGDSFNTFIIGSTTVQQVVEKTVASKGLPADMYALYIILGDTESQRVLCFSERLLHVMCGAGTDYFLCLKRNECFETLEPYFETCGTSPVSVHVREKKRWKKYPCYVRDGQFIQFKDAKCHKEVYRAGVNSFNVFAGIQRSRLDVKNPMPTRYGFWIKSMKGDDQSRYFCADKEDDMMKIMAAIIKTKFPSCLQSPIFPVHMDSLSSPPYSECTSSVLPPQR